MERTIVADDSLLDLKMVIEGVSEKMMEEEANLRTAKRNFDNELIAIVLGKVSGNRKRAARILGVSQSRLSQRLNQGKYGWIE